jgi:hypothetical protein
MITFVCFHMDIRKDDLDSIPRQWHGIVVKEERHAYIETALFSCRAQHIGCRTVVLTDRFTPFPTDTDHEVFRCDGLDSTRLMHSRSLAWINFLQTADSHVVFLDSDILIQENLEPVFNQVFDAGLTYRQEDQWPINAGIQFFHHNRLDRGVAFLRACLHAFETHFQNFAAWGGDQDALRKVTAGAAFDRSDSHLWHSPDGFNLLMLPCARYNYSTPTGRMPGPYPNKPVLHFKGKRKDDMIPYWERYLNPVRLANNDKER